MTKTGDIIDDTIIDNKHIILQDQLRKILPDTIRANIAVGYFFISGFAEIVDYFNKINSSTDTDDIVRILISPTTDKKTAEALVEGFEQIDAVKSKIKLNKLQSNVTTEEIASDTANTIVKSLQYMPQTQSDQDVSRKLIEMMKNKKLEVRVYTKEQLHAKAYIFELDDKHIPAIGIVGSSNMSLAGIREHSELNLKTRDLRDVAGLLRWFNEHWNESVPFTAKVAKILERSWAGKQYDPIDVYHKALMHEFGDKFDPKKTDDIMRTSILKLFEFQKHAVVDALSALEKYDGVIIADVVGLGKTFVGSTILKHLQERYRNKALIICPPHLKSMWSEFCDSNEIYAEIISRGKIGRDNFKLDRYLNCDLVLLDESHNFRNSGTNSYQSLSNFMDRSQAKIIMLTATPLSNRPSDIKNQLKLFPGGNNTKIPPANEIGLDSFFKQNFSSTDMSNLEHNVLKDFLQHVMIRRTRRYIKNEYAQMDERKRPYLLVNGQRKYFPEREMAHPDQYDIDKVYNKKYDMIEDLLSKTHLNLARYAPGVYIRTEYESNPLYSELKSSPTAMSGIIRISLLKRMESSVKAFHISIKHYIKGHELFLKLLNKNIMPIGKDFAKEIYERISHGDDYDGIQDVDDLKTIKSKYSVNAFNIELMKIHIQNDIDIFKTINSHLDYDFYKNDDKLHKFTEIIRQNLGKKILVFTESAVTARYISEYLKKNIDGIQDKMSEIDSRTKNKMDLMRRFDPTNNIGIAIPTSEQLDILISTDVLSEGVNLQLGEIVINYDFHWNPVKLIQRVGRVDRLGSEHEKIKIVNFLSNPKIDEKSSLRDIVSSKIERIHKIVGSDYAILEENEVINENDVYAVYYERDEHILDVDNNFVFEPSKFESDIRNIARKNRDHYNAMKNIPYGIRSTISQSGILFIACESESFLDDDRLPNFKKYYVVTTDDVKAISQNKFFTEIHKRSNKKQISQSKQYNKFVEYAWKQFNQDMKNACSRQIPKKSYQKWFTDKLAHLTITLDNSTIIANFLTLDIFINWQHLGRPANIPEIRQYISDLRKFCTMSVYQRNADIELKNLRNHARDEMSDKQFLANISDIYELYGKSTKRNFERTMMRPRILYSMMT